MKNIIASLLATLVALTNVNAQEVYAGGVQVYTGDKIKTNKTVELTLTAVSITPNGDIREFPPVWLDTNLYHGQVTAIGGKEPYTYYVSGGIFPPGWVLNPFTGEIQQTASLLLILGYTGPQYYAFRITAVDKKGNTGDIILRLYIFPKPLDQR